MYNAIMDCDPGNDDAIKLLLASRAENTRILGGTTVAGNSTLENVTRNARRVLDCAGVANVNVYAGEEPTRGETVANLQDVTGRAPNCHVAGAANRERVRKSCISKGKP